MAIRRVPVDVLQLSVFRNNTNIGNTAQNISADPCAVYAWIIDNPNTVDVFVKLYNKVGATASDTPLFTSLRVPAGGTVVGGAGIRIEFATALSIRATTERADNGTTSPSTAIDVTIFYNAA